MSVHAKRTDTDPCCPSCGSHRVGRVGNKQYYCWNCMVEYNTGQEIFLVTEDGTLVACARAGGEDSVV